MRHFGNKTQLYALAVQLAGDRFLHALYGQLESRRATLAETLAAWVWTLENGGDVSALVCAGSGGDRSSAIAPELDALNDRLVGFWQRRLDLERRLAGTRPNRVRELARLIVAAAPAFALTAEVPPLGGTAPRVDLAEVLECVALDCSGDHERAVNGSTPGAPPTYTTRDRLRGTRRDDPGWITRRELEVLLEVEKGVSNKEIARALGMTEHTVKFHLKNIFRKLCVARRTEALKVARERRLI